MDTNRNDRRSAVDETRTDAERKRDESQREQVEAQARGATGAELKAFARELVADHRQFPDDVALDARDPERRVDEEQGTVTQPGSEPAEEA